MRSPKTGRQPLLAAFGWLTPGNGQPKKSIEIAACSLKF
jgi:hypothetical protein